MKVPTAPGVNVTVTVQETAAATLTRTAETTQQISTTVAAASQEASDNVNSVAAASEELARSVVEIGRHVQQSSKITVVPAADSSTILLTVPAFTAVERR